VLHPRYGIEREYAIGLDQPLTTDQAWELHDGIRLDEGLAQLSDLRPATRAEIAGWTGLLDPPPDPRLTWYHAILQTGYKRQLRRMFAAVGAPVARLVRVRIGPVVLGRLRSGRVRPLNQREVDRLTAAGVDRRG
jgi:23S rRNA pseudouridine2605 synthase